MNKVNSRIRPQRLERKEEDQGKKRRVNRKLENEKKERNTER